MRASARAGPAWSVELDLDGGLRVDRKLVERPSAIVRRAPDDAAVALLDVAERDLHERQPELAWRGFDAVRARLS